VALPIQVIYFMSMSLVLLYESGIWGSSYT
jgi:hypothetical protein